MLLTIVLTRHKKAPANVALIHSAGAKELGDRIRFTPVGENG